MQHDSVASDPTRVAAALLRGEPVPWPSGLTRSDFLNATAAHDLQPLLAHQLRRSGQRSHWPDEIGTALTDAAHLETLTEVPRRRELKQVLATLDAAGVRGLLIKGAALAYLEYPDPALRPRRDADLLIRRGDLDGLDQVMKALGYRRRTSVAGDVLMPQCTFEKKDRFGIWHDYDVHVKISNRMEFSGLLCFEEAAARSIAVPPLGESARTLCPVDALLLACCHRVAHHHDSKKLLWLYDIHLLADGLDRPGFARFAALATAKQVRAVCLRGLMLANRWFGTRVPAEVLDTLAAHHSMERTAAFLGGRMSQAEILWSDFSALSEWSDRWRLLHEHLFPPAHYMRERYALPSSVPLFALYTYRALRGARRWFHRG